MITKIHKAAAPGTMRVVLHWHVVAKNVLMIVGGSTGAPASRRATPTSRALMGGEWAIPPSAPLASTMMLGFVTITAGVDIRA